MKNSVECRRIDTDHGPTFVRICGTGKPVLIVHGGPGFDHSYLFKHLSRLSEKRTLIFYDQPGCGETEGKGKSQSLNSAANHLLNVLGQTVETENAGVIAHSWGCLLVAAALHQNQSRTTSQTMPLFDEGAFINPAPFTGTDYQNVGKLLRTRISLWKLISIYAMFLGPASGEKVMKKLIPYYGPTSLMPDDYQVSLNKKTYATLTQSLGDFDVTAALSTLRNISLIFGENDYAGQTYVEPLTKIAKASYMVNDAAHFPFLENPTQFQKIMDEIFQ